MASIRQRDGFRRYALAIQYHGRSFLGFSLQRNQENSILSDGTDLRGLRTVEGRLRDALTTLVGKDNFEHLQVSSRTDRGVHAIKNTCHVDVRPRRRGADPLDLPSFHKGINYHLSRQASHDREEFMNHMRVTSVKHPPRMKNLFFDGTEANGPEYLDWNARFSATERTYIYRILHTKSESGLGIPFEWDRSWRITDPHDLNVDAMNEAAQFLVGTHDFSTFRGKGCEQSSPVLTLHEATISSQPHDILFTGCMDENFGEGEDFPNLIVLKFRGKRFLYRQVRNMVGCLLEVGRMTLSISDVKTLMERKERQKAPAMAPAHGLFLADVKHGDFT